MSIHLLKEGRKKRVGCVCWIYLCLWLWCRSRYILYIHTVYYTYMRIRQPRYIRPFFLLFALGLSPGELHVVAGVGYRASKNGRRYIDRTGPYVTTYIYSREQFRCT